IALHSGHWTVWPSQSAGTRTRCRQAGQAITSVSAGMAASGGAINPDRIRNGTRPPHADPGTTMTRALLFCLPLTLTLALPLLPAADPVVSGVPIGKRPGPYSFLVATGPQRGQPTCYICEQHDGGKPAAVVFARTLSDPLGKLMAKLDAARPAKNDPGYKVWLTHTVASADLDGLA